MAKKRFIIPPDIDAELSPRARGFFVSTFDQMQQKSDEQKKEIKKLLARIAVLEKQLLKLTPKNSSIPPSTVHPHAKPDPKPKKEPKEPKKQGGQPGHKRTTKPLVPTEDCDEVVVLKPKSCRKCTTKLHGKDEAPLRHQVFELPEIKASIVEYQLERLTCKNCGTQTCAQLPTGVPQGQCGPRLAAMTGLLMGHFRQSKRRTASFLTDLLKIPCSPSWTVKIQNTVSRALEAPYNELQAELTKQSQLFVDESPTKENNKKAWLWAAVAPLFAVFVIFLSRKREALNSLVGKYQHIIINCDRAKMYYDCKQLQWCWAHLKRDFQKLIDNPDKQVKRLGHDLMRQERLLFLQWRKYKEGLKTWQGFQDSVAPIREKIHDYLLRGMFSGNKKIVGICKSLSENEDWLWTFTRVEGIEPTNNRAEQALRPAVIHRKLSFGTQSATGSRFIERMLTVSETCRIQGRSTYDYMVSAMQAHYNKEAAPTLLPTKNPTCNVRSKNAA
jgi:transposase